MTFGAYIRNLLTDRGISLSDLTESLNIKSKNELYRLFENKNSYEKSLDLVNRILSVVEIEENERETLYSLMQPLKIRKATRSANGILELLYRPNLSEGDCFKPVVDFINEHKNLELQIYLGLLEPSENVRLAKAVRECSDCRIEHAVNFNAAETTIACELFTVISLFLLDCYQAYESSRFSEETFLLAKRDGRCTLAVYDGRQLVQSEVSAELAEYIADKRRSDCSERLRHQKNKVSDYIEIMNASSMVETHDIYTFYGMQCLGDIPYPVLYELFENANFFGFPADHPYVHALCKSAKNKEELRLHSQSTKHYILCERYVREFWESGRTLDYLTDFRPLTDAEKREMLSRFWEHTDGARFRGRFLNDMYEPIPVECIYVQNVGIHLLGGMDKLHWRMLITHPKAVRVYKNFVEWFWENATLSEAESIEKMKKITETNTEGRSK